MFKIGVVGTRGLSGIASINATTEAQVVAVCDLDQSVLDRATEKYPDMKTYRIFEDMLAADIDAVFIATPMQCHVPQAIAALQAGKHVYSEVTAGVTIDELWFLIEAVEKSKKVYMMAENYCYSPAVVLVGELVKAGLFGEVYFGEGEYLHDVRSKAATENGDDTWRKYWQLGKRGCFYPTHSLGPVSQWFGGERITEISCFGTGGTFASPYYRQDESTITCCKTESGKLIKIRVDCKSERPHNMHYYSLQGTKGCYEAPRGMGDDHKIWLKDHAQEGKCEWRPLFDFKEYLPERYKNPSEIAKKAGHQGGDFYVVLDFIDACLGRRENPIDVYTAAEWTAVGILSELSVMNGGRVMEMPRFVKNMRHDEKIIRV